MNVTNASVFRVSLSQCIGFIMLDGAHCSSPKVTNLPELEHGRSVRVELDQDLNDAVAKDLTERVIKGIKVNVGCLNCKFVFQVRSGSYDKQIDIPIRDGGLPCIPEGVVMISGAKIGQVIN